VSPVSERPDSTQPRTHDYSGPNRGWAHDYTFTPAAGGLWGDMTGWGPGIREGDFLLLDNRGRSSRYSVETISYYVDPPDMWQARVAFAPRRVGEPGE
jgi:hypothetical protein